MSDEHANDLPVQAEESITEETVDKLQDLAEVDAALEKMTGGEELHSEVATSEDEPAEEQLTEIQALQKKVEALEKQRSDKDRHINKIQKKYDEVLESKEQELEKLKSEASVDEGYGLTPEQVQKQVEIALLQKEIQRERIENQTKHTKALILAAEPDFEEYVEDIARAALESQADPVLVEKFKQNPYQLDSAELMQRLEAAKKTRHLNALLEREMKIKESDKSHREAISKVAESNTLRNGSGIGASNTAPPEYSDKQIASMNNLDDVNKILQERLEREN